MKPLDSDMITALAREHEIMLTLEEGSFGGFGAHVMDFLAGQSLLETGLKSLAMTLPDAFLEQDSPAAMYDRAGLNATQIVETAQALLDAAPVKIFDLKPNKA